MALTTIDLHGKILQPVTNTPAVGTVTFKILDELRDNADNTVYSPQEFNVTLVGGEFTITLPVTDDPNVTPLDWSYWVYVDTDVWNSGVFFMPLPTALGPVAEFADILPLTSTSGSCTPDGSACAPIGIVGVVAALEEQVDALQVEVDALEAEITGFQTQIDALDVRLDDVEADILTIQGQIATIQGQITTIQGQIATLQGQVATNTTNITTLQGQVTTIQGQITTLQTDLTNLTTRVTTLEGNAVLLNPTSAGTYNGNTFTAPPNPAGVQPWLKSNVIPYSAGDTNFDIVRFRAQDEFGNTVNTGTYNGNGEGRDRPSSRSRVARRTFESAEAVGGSTGQYAQWSSDATIATNREPFLGGWGSASPKPGWVEATRVLSGLAGMSIGGTVNATLAPYNSLTPFIFRGLKATAGPPAAGTWAVNDAVLDSVGILYRCTVAGTPGTWVGAVNGAPVAVGFTGLMGNAATISDGTSTGAPYALTTTYNPADNRVYFDGAMANNGGVSIAGGTVLFTVNAAHVPAAWVQCNERTSTTLSARVTIRPDGTCRLDQAMAAGATVSLDGYNFRKS